MTPEKLTRMITKQILEIVNHSDIQEIINEEIQKRIGNNIFVYSNIKNSKVIYANDRKDAIKKLVKLLLIQEKCHFNLRLECKENKIPIYKCIVCNEEIHDDLRDRNKIEHYLSHEEDTIIDSIFDNNIKIFQDVEYVN